MGKHYYILQVLLLFMICAWCSLRGGLSVLQEWSEIFTQLPLVAFPPPHSLE